MTIRRRLVLSFLAILVLFGLNLVIYLAGNQKRQTTVEALRIAISRQILISSLRNDLGDIQKQVSLLSEVIGDTSGSGVDAGEQAQFNAQLGNIRRQIQELRDMTGAEARPKVDALLQACEQVLQSWDVVYRNFGVNHATAIAELAVKADPLSHEILDKLLPDLQHEENRRVEAARANFYHVARITDTITILIFIVSIVVAVAVAHSVSRYLSRGLAELKKGAGAIGSGDLERRIEVKGRDELTELASAFNEMAGGLLAARRQLEEAHAQERRKSEELRETMQQLGKAQDQLVMQQKLASLGALTAGIAHEIKNPLNFVTNFADLSVDLARELREVMDAASEMPPQLRGELENILADLEGNMLRIRDHGKRADGIVRGMLMHSRGKPGEREEVNLNTLVGEYVKLAYHGMRAQNADFNITIEEDYDPNVAPICVVSQDLSRVFLNIANNACYAAFEKKKTARDGFMPTLAVRTRELGDAVEVRIRDNGNGICEENRRKIFEPFFTTKPAGSGTGLGLSLSYDIVVQMHKGELRLESEPGKYAEFVIRLPRPAAMQAGRG